MGLPEKLNFAGARTPFYVGEGGWVAVLIASVEGCSSMLKVPKSMANILNPRISYSCTYQFNYGTGYTCELGRHIM